MRAALYDLSVDLATWDFVTWAVHVRDLGYQKINFQTKTIPPNGRKWLSPQEIRKRLDNFMLPATRALGLDYGFEPRGDRWRSQHYYDLRPNFQRMEIPAKWHGQHTVTLREVAYRTQRNSDRTIWLEFAKRIDAIVIEEHAHRPITFEERFKLYAGASMNWGVTNGPLSAVFLTPYPLTMMCDWSKDVKGFSGHHLGPGAQLQFSLPNQNLVWGPITLERLLRQYELSLDDRVVSVGQPLCRCALTGYFAVN